MTDAATEKWVSASPSDPVVKVAARTLKGRLGMVRHYLPLAAERADEDTEYVHQLRVWTRRSTSALHLYAGLLPRRVAWLEKQLKRVRRAANDARNCDVFVGRVTESDHPGRGDKHWRGEVRRERVKAQKRIVAVHQRLMGRGQFARRVKNLIERIRPRGEAAAIHAGCFGRWSRARLFPVVGRFFATAPGARANAAALHTFRVRGKELRYDMELLGGAFPAEFRTRLYPAVEALLDRLGEVNDSATAMAFYRTKMKAAKTPEQAVMWRQLMAGEQVRLAGLRRQFQTEYSADAIRAIDNEFEALSGDIARED